MSKQENTVPLRASSRVREVPVSALKQWAENPRRITPERLEVLKTSLTTHREMLSARPLMALPDGTVFGGNQRLVAAVALGWKTVPVRVFDIPYETARILNLIDNNQQGEWDDDRLATLLAEIAADGVDLALTGFDSRELDRLLATLTPAADPDEIPPLPGKPRSKRGEVYLLGEHLVACGDATDRTFIAEVFGELRAEVMWSDPPYGVDYVGKTSKRLTIQNDSAAGLGGLLRGAFSVASEVLAASARFYVAAPAGPLGIEFRLAIADTGWRLHQSLVWVKNAPVLGHSDHHYQHEDVLYGWTPGDGRPGRGRHQGSRWFGGNDASSVFFHDRPSRSLDHPTAKPVGLIEQHLRNSSRRGDIVYDPFAGSGSTLIACERLARRCIAIEIDPAYVDVIRRRYEEQTNAQ